MKKEFTVKVMIDDETENFLGKTSMHTCRARPDEFTITVCKDLHTSGYTEVPDLIANALAHEFGHVIGYALNLPGAKADPRSPLCNIGYGLAFNYGDAVIASETEAWDIAEKMLSFQTTRREALASYKEGYGLKP